MKLNLKKIPCVNQTGQVIKLKRYLFFLVFSLIFFIFFSFFSLQLFRHGDRSPTHLFAWDSHKSEWDQGPGQLTRVCCYVIYTLCSCELAQWCGSNYAQHIWLTRGSFNEPPTPRVLKPPPRRTCSISILKLIFTTVPIPPCVCVCVCVCVSVWVCVCVCVCVCVYGWVCECC